MTETRRITLQFPSLRAFLAEYGERMSADGMLLRSEVPPAAGSMVDIEVVVAEGMRLLRARGETLWSGAAADGQQAAAVRFTELDDASRTLIDRIVDQRRREGLDSFNLADISPPREAGEGVGGAPLEAPAGADGSVFDLATPPEPPAVDLFESPAAEQAPAAGGEPSPPVPLLAEPAPVPFDLAPEEPPGGSELAAGDLQLEPDPVGPQSSLPVETDLSNLFGGDEPGISPASGRTEAFPPSFVDEVEAELEAAGAPETRHEEAGTGELEIEPRARAEESAEPEPEAAGEEPTPDVAPPIEAAPEPAPEPAPKEPGEQPPETLAQLSPTIEGVPPQVAESFAAEHGPETVEIPVIQAPPPPAVDEEDEAELEPAPQERPGEELPPVVTAPPPVPGPTARKPAAPPALDDNLLSLPELNTDGPAAGAVAEPVDHVPLPTSAESLRGAAGPSRRLGTWLLIALLVAALAVAGYFIYGLMQEGGPSEPRQVSEEPPSPAPAADSAAPAEDGEPADVTPAEPAPPEPAAGEKRPAGVDEVASTEEPADVEPEPAPEPPAPEPPAPLTGLDRITWSESDTGTVLTLVGDGDISPDSIELVPIAGVSPRLVIKIPGVERAFQPAVLQVGTVHVERVRTGLQAGGELHVVVDLAAAGISVRGLEARGSRLELRVGPE